MTEPQIEIRFNPTVPLAGAQSSIPWDAFAVQHALRVIFNVGARERLVRVDVTPEGLKGYFEPKEAA